MPEAAHFSPALFTFLRDLRENNDRDWFQENKSRYEASIKDPALRFISDFGPHLARISPHFSADPRPVGGSLFRIYRDVRFSKDKSPYKTAVGIQFRHKGARDVHAPGFYLHLEPGEVFAAAGIWHPDGPALKAIRDAIVEQPTRWRRALGSEAFRQGFELGGDSLKRPPRGYDPEHPLVDDLKRKDFICSVKLTQRDVTSAGFAVRLAGRYRQTRTFVRFLCDAVGAEF